MLSPFIDSSVVNVTPDFNQSLLQFINIPKRPIDPLLHDTTNIVK